MARDGDGARMLTERNLWVGATTMAIGILLLMLLQLPAERRGRPTPRFDEPGAAARGDMACRPPGNGWLDTPLFYTREPETLVRVRVYTAPPSVARHPAVKCA